MCAELVQVKVVYGSVFAELAGVPQETLDLEIPTVEGLVREIRRRQGPAFDKAFGETGPESHPDGVAILVNGCSASLATKLRSGDEVAILLSFSGGAG